MAATIIPIATLVSVQSPFSSSISRTKFHLYQLKLTPLSSSSSSISKTRSCTSNSKNGFGIVACLDSSSAPPRNNFNASTRLYVSGLSFRTNQEGLRNAFEKFGKLIEVNLVMDKIANRPRGFAFLRYATEEESKAAIEGMHGKFLDGRVIFVEVARPRSEIRQRQNQDSRPFRAE